MANRAFSIAKFTLLPGILPRVNKLMFTGFAPLGFSVAQACAALRLLPQNHPYNNPDNYGRFGVRHVMAETRRRLVFDRAHSDQIVLYYTLLLGFLLMAAQFVLMIVALTTKSAYADTTDVRNTMISYFTLDPGNEKTDIAYRLLDIMYGFTGIFNSSDMNTTPFHTGLHVLFHFYNLGILAVAIIVLLYMVTTLVAETAETGTPFGRRFNGAWAPLRLIWAFGMLCPLTFGMNGAQLTTIYVAKWGSNLATNSWIKFIDSLGGSTPLGQKELLIVEPQWPSINTMVEFLFVAETCGQFQKLMYGRTINGYIIRGTPPTAATTGGTGTTSTTTSGTSSDKDAMLFLPAQNAANGSETSSGANVTFKQAAEFSNNQNIYMRFGDQSTDYTDQQGQVRPICGDMTFQIKDLTQPGALSMQESWFKLIGQIWQDSVLNQSALNLAKHYVPNEDRDPMALFPSGVSTKQEFIARGLEIQKLAGKAAIDTARKAQVDSGKFDESFRTLGWAGAAIWYNKLSEMNGAFIAAVHNLPRPSHYTEVMENVVSQKRANDSSVDPVSRFRPYLSNNTLVAFSNPSDAYEAMAEYEAQQVWQDGYPKTGNSPIIDGIKGLFGLNDLFSMQKNIADGINPLSQIIGMGRSLLESGMENFGYSVGGSLVANILAGTPISSIGTGVSKLLSRFAMIGIGIGFMLSYVVPSMPFIYFFFSAGTWLKSIFVGLVSMPLWAIAHMRIDGEGLPGPGAMNGYFLLFEIFIRPVLMVIGLVGGLLIFSAEAFVLSQVWDLVTSNVTGFDYCYAASLKGSGIAMPANCPTTTLNATTAAATVFGTTTGTTPGAMMGMRGVIDQFMATFLFAVVVYMMALSSFKMCDAVPDNIMRWMGFHTPTFGQKDQNLAEGAVGKISSSIDMLANPSDSVLISLLSRNS